MKFEQIIRGVWAHTRTPAKTAETGKFSSWHSAKASGEGLHGANELRPEGWLRNRLKFPWAELTVMKDQPTRALSMIFCLELHFPSHSLRPTTPAAFVILLQISPFKFLCPVGDWMSLNKTFSYETPFQFHTAARQPKKILQEELKI